VGAELFKEGVRLFGGFFDQETHFGVGGLEINGEAVGAKGFRGGGADGGFEDGGEGGLENAGDGKLLGDLEEVSNLDAGGEKGDVDVAVDEGMDGGAEGS